ncbi:RCC1 domain-containing protein [Tessaracoccus sp.]|uniref:RCC1 domain-containing protein n=1 Tax=Tessaracoccus sp. TaxID=1971211 RepID=UPI002613B23B|nr:hypothetical protein [Tessaracoccus sp.]
MLAGLVAGPASAASKLKATPTPTISGTVAVGKKLTVKAGSWKPAPVELSYQWLRDGKSIKGATKKSYTLTASDTGKKITVKVTGSKKGYAKVSKTSKATAKVKTGTLSKSPVPKISGTTQVGKKLTANPGTWKPSGVKLAYQWLRGGKSIKGATKPSYVLTASDKGKTISVKVIGSKKGYKSVAKTSKPTAKVAKPAPTVTGATPSISGSTKVGSKLTAKPGTWKPSGVKLSYQWLRDGKKIKEATTSSYTLTASDKGKKISVAVTGSKKGYTSVTLTSKPTDAIGVLPGAYALGAKETSVPVNVAASARGAVLVRVVAHPTDKDATVLQGGSPIMTVTKGTSASTTFIAKATDGKVALSSTAAIRVDVEPVATLLSTPAAPGSVIVLDAPERRADTRDDLAGAKLGTTPVTVGLVGKGGVPTIGVRQVFVTLTATLDKPGKVTLDGQSLALPKGTSTVTTVITPSDTGDVAVRTDGAAGELLLDVRAYVTETAGPDGQVNQTGSVLPAVNPKAQSLSATTAGAKLADASFADSASQLVLVSVAPTSAGPRFDGDVSLSKAGAVVDKTAGALPQLVAAKGRGGAVKTTVGSASVTAFPVASVLGGPDLATQAAPALAITGPAENATIDLAQEMIELTGTVAGPNAIDRVEIYNGDDFVGVAELSIRPKGQTWRLRTAAPKSGSTTFRVVAITRQDKTAEARRTVRVELPASTEVVLNDQAVLLDQEPVNITKVTDDAVVLDKRPDLQPGQPIVSDATPEAPNGLLRKVSAIDQVDGKWVVTTEPAAITDVVLQAEVDEVVDLVTSEAILQPTDPGQAPDVEFIDEGVDDVVITTPGAARRAIGPQGLDVSAGNQIESKLAIVYYQDKKSDTVKVKDLSRAKSWEKGGSVESKVQLEAKAKLSLKLHLKVDINLEWEWGIPKVVTREFSVYTTTSIESSVTLEASVKWALTKKYERQLAKLPLGTHTFAIGFVPIVIKVEGTFSITSEVSLEMKASVSFEQSWEAKNGFTYSTKNGYKPIDESKRTGSGPEMEPELALSASAKLMGEAGPKLRISFMLYEAAGPYLEAGVSAGFSAEVKGKTTTGGKTSIEFEGQLYVKAKGAIGVILKIPVIDFTVVDSQFPIEGKWNLKIGIKFSAPVADDGAGPGPIDPTDPGGGGDNSHTKVVQIASTAANTCALLSSGTVKCWGQNGQGNLGDGTSESRSTPVAVSGLSGATTLTTGFSHTCALLSDGTVKCWGGNSSGQLGDGTTHDRSTPVAVSGLSRATALIAAGEHSCALLSDGTVKCWGGNSSGQLGDGTTQDRPTPVTVSGLSGATTLTTSNGHTCALLPGGTVKCWGYNGEGQLGDGTTQDGTTQEHRSTPVTVSGLSGATALTVVDGHSCALLSGGTVKCWGTNWSGQLGDGTTQDRSTPVSVSELSGATALTTGSSHTCALLSSGTVKCWGYNGWGRLGDGTTQDRSTPVSVSELSGVTALTAADERTCALLSAGTVNCWGYNGWGLGDGSTEPRSTPVTVSGLSGATALTFGQVHTCALLSDGTVKCWGFNRFGELGDGTTENRSTPVTVVGLG